MDRYENNIPLFHKATYSIYLLLAVLCFSRCQHPGKTGNTAELDSISSRCYDLLVELKTDELRNLAKDYIEKTAQGSKRYFEAQQFYINSYFNAKDYPHTLELLKKAKEDPALAQMPASYGNYLYTEARCYQFSKQYPQAISIYRKILDIEPDADTDNADKEVIYKLHVVALMQTMYSYYFAGKVQDGFKAFVTLDQECPKYIAKHYRRDLLSIFAYAANLANKRDTARILIDQALSLPSYNNSRENRCRDYIYAAEIYRAKSPDREAAIRYFEESLHISQEDQSISGEQYVMSILGDLYTESGDYTKSIQLYNTAAEVALRRNDPNAVAGAYLALSYLYKRYELSELATLYADKGMDYASVRNNFQHLGNALELKAKLLIHNHPDSAFCLLDSAITCFDKGQLERNWLGAMLTKATYLINTSATDSLAEGLNILHSLSDKKLSESQQSDHLYQLIRGLDKTGQRANLSSLCTQLEGKIAHNASNEEQYNKLQYLIDLYTREGKAEKVMELTSLWRPAVALKLSEDVTRYITAAHIKYQTEKKEQELILLQSELKIKQLSIAVYIAIIFLLILVITYGILWWQQRKRQLRHLFDQLIRRHLVWKELNLALTERQDFPQDGQTILPLNAPDTADDTSNDNMSQPETYRRIYHRVLLIMEREHPFLDPNLDLTALARLACTNRSQLSAALNQQTGNNFSTWLAEYRVNYLMERLSLSPNKSMDELYIDAGFPSRTSFYRQFRQITGLTPGQYMKHRER